MSLRFGRDETVPAVTLVGRRGGEGKSFFFAPVQELLGLDYVQLVPQKGTAPLLNLDKKKGGTGNRVQYLQILSPRPTHWAILAPEEGL